MLDVSGQPLVVRYRAGANIGYVVDNLDEVLARTTPSADSASAPAAPAVLALGLDDFDDDTLIRLSSPASDRPHVHQTTSDQEPAVPQALAPPAQGFRPGVVRPQPQPNKLNFGSRNIPVVSSHSSTSGSSQGGQEQRLRFHTRPAPKFPNFAQVTA